MQVRSPAYAGETSRYGVNIIIFYSLVTLKLITKQSYKYYYDYYYPKYSSFG